jgi:hypothetical protein
MNLKKVTELLDRELCIPENRTQQSWSNDFARMDRDGGRPAVGMFHEYVAAASPIGAKTSPFKSTDEFFALGTGQPSHTEIC